MRSLLLISAIFLVLSSLPISTIVLGGSLVASWRFDDSSSTVHDVINGHTGSLNGGSWTSSAIVFNSSGYAWDLGKGNTNTPWALYFNGKEDYMEVPDASVLRAGNFSVAFWISPDISNDWGKVMGKAQYATGKSAGWAIQWDASTPRLMHLIVFDSSHQEQDSAGVDVPLGVWTHLAFTVGADRISAYINGKLVGNTSCSSFLPSTEPFRIGRVWSDSNYFDGLIDDVQFYNTSLTQTDIKNIYQNYTTTTEHSTILQLNQISTGQGQESNLTAKLVDDTMGRALTNVNVTFSINNQRLGTVRTDSRGTAQIQYIPQETGTFSLTAEFNGTGTYYGCVQTIQLGGSGSPLQQQVLFGVAAGGGTIVLGAVIIVRRKRRSSVIEWGSDMQETIGGFSMRDIVRTLELSADSLDRTAKAFERAVGNGSG